MPDGSGKFLHPRLVMLPVPLDRRKSLADWHVAKEEAGCPSLSFSTSKSNAIEWTPGRKSEAVPAFGLPAYPVILGMGPVDPRKAVRAIRRVMAKAPAAYVVSRAAFKDLARNQGVVIKSIVSPTAWPVLVEKDEESADEEGMHHNFNIRESQQTHV